MKRSLFTLSLNIIIIYTALGYISYQTNFPLILPAPNLSSERYYDYSGVTHTQTLASTGSGTIEDIALAAEGANCQFVILTDLNIFSDQSSLEGYKRGVLVLSGGKFSYMGGHLLTYNFGNQWPFGGPGQAQIHFNEMLQSPPKSKTMLVAANPFLPRHQWNDLNLNGLSGMEILNLDSLWNANLVKHKLSVAWSILMLPFNPDLSYLRLFSEPVQELAAWDKNLEKRKFTGWAGSGATAKIIPFPDKVLKFPTYKRSFKLIKNHLLLKSELTGQFLEDKQKIMSGFKQGHFYFSVDILGDPKGFYFIAKKNGQEFLLGDSVELKKGPVRLIAGLGREMSVPHEILLLKNGNVIESTTKTLLVKDIFESGAYRVVVRIKPKLPIPDGITTFSWIYSNAIRVE